MSSELNLDSLVSDSVSFQVVDAGIFVHKDVGFVLVSEECLNNSSFCLDLQGLVVLWRDRSAVNRLEDAVDLGRVSRGGQVRSEVLPLRLLGIQDDLFGVLIGEVPGCTIFRRTRVFGDRSGQAPFADSKVRFLRPPALRALASTVRNMFACRFEDDFVELLAFQIDGFLFVPASRNCFDISLELFPVRFLVMSLRGI